MATKILLNADEITKYTIIGGNVDIDRILPSIKTCQELKIKKLLGTALYNKICDDFSTNTLTGLYLELYDDYVKSLVIHGSTAIFLQSGAYIVSDNGITKGKSETADSVSKEEVDFLVQSSRQLYDDYKQEFLEWIKINGGDIPQYITNTQNNNSSRILNVGGWVLRRPNRCNNCEDNENYY
jgi:hypothetical protein